MAGYRVPDGGTFWKTEDDYNHAFFRQLQREVEQHWEFMAWLKMTHPEALIEWRALEKIKES